MIRQIEKFIRHLGADGGYAMSHIGLKPNADTGNMLKHVRTSAALAHFPYQALNLFGGYVIHKL